MLPMLLLSNLRLVVFLFGALVFGAMSWLYFDALFVRPQKNVFLRALGALIIAGSYLLGAVLVEGIAMGWTGYLEAGVGWIRTGGYLILAWGVWSEPLSKRPQVVAFVGSIPTWSLPILPALVGLGYWRRASVGLERHLQTMAYGMYVLALAETLDLRRLFVASSDIRVYELVRDFGNVWIIQLAVLAVGFVMISRWVFSYLLRRFETQLTLFMGMLVMGVFTLATMVFTYVMANRLQLGAEREVEAGARMTSNNWARMGDELAKRANELTTISTENKEELARILQGGERVIDAEGRDEITGEKVESLVEGVGYRVVGVGSGRRIEQVAVAKRESGWVMVAQEVDGARLGKSAEELGMAVRLYDQKTVIGSSSVPDYPKIASPLGLTEVKPGRIGGVEYTRTLLPLKTSEGVIVAQLETAIPVASLWKSVGVALFWTYLAGVVVLLIMELPAVLIANYLVRQLR